MRQVGADFPPACCLRSRVALTPLAARRAFTRTRPRLAADAGLFSAQSQNLIHEADDLGVSIGRCGTCFASRREGKNKV
jgi:hypothetical protein